MDQHFFSRILSRISPAFQLILIVAFMAPHLAHSRLREFETTRLKSTAGAGVGSLLLNEAAILNPASLAYFETSSLHFQMERHSYETDNDDSAQSSTANSFDQNKSFIAADTRRIAKGAFSYQDFYDGYDHRQRLTLGTAIALSKSSSIGFSARHTTDDLSSPSVPVKEKYTQFILGATHVVGESLSVGVIVIDPMKTKLKDSRVILGTQFMLSEIFALIADAGAFYEKDPSNTFMIKAAVQVNVLSDFYLRGGVFQDKAIKERGSGIGFSWVGPRLALDAALKTTKSMGSDDESINNGQKLSETSVSLSFLF